MKLTSLSAALLLSSTAAYAQLAPQDILDSWRGFYAGFGATISTSAPVVTGDVTRFANVFSQMNMSGSEARYSFDYIDMQSNADGSIDIRFSPSGFATTFIEVEGHTLESRTTYDLGALTIHAEGVPEDIRFTYDAAVVTAHQSQTMPDGAEMAATVALENVLGTARSTQMDGLISDSGSMTIAGFTAKISIDPPDEAQIFLDYNAENFNVSYDIGMPARAIPARAEAMDFYHEDMVFGMNLGTGPATLTAVQEQETGKGRFTFAQSGGDISMSFAENAMRYGMTITNGNLGLANPSAQAADFTAAFARFHIGSTIPMRKSDMPAPYALAFALEGFTIGDDIWARIDPEATLSRAPASFSFALNGTLKMFTDLFDRTGLPTLPEAPFELLSLSLSDLNLDFEGMDLTGEGDLTFNSERKDPITGMLEPNGALEFSINGALGMLDKIGRLGFMDPMVIIGAKGALGMFAAPNEGPDSFSTRIEFSDGGHISVNGQQVK